jgi:hypothetical protein
MRPGYSVIFRGPLTEEEKRKADMVDEFILYNTKYCLIDLF